MNNLNKVNLHLKSMKFHQQILFLMKKSILVIKDIYNIHLMDSNKMMQLI